MAVTYEHEVRLPYKKLIIALALVALIVLSGG